MFHFWIDVVTNDLEIGIINLMTRSSFWGGPDKKLVEVKHCAASKPCVTDYQEPLKYFFWKCNQQIFSWFHTVLQVSWDVISRCTQHFSLFNWVAPHRVNIQYLWANWGSWILSLLTKAEDHLGDVHFSYLYQRVNQGHWVGGHRLMSGRLAQLEEFRVWDSGPRGSEWGWQRWCIQSVLLFEEIKS